jgi:hypothetical protein
MSHVYVLTHWSDESGVYEYIGVFATPMGAMQYVGNSHDDEIVKWERDNDTNVLRWNHMFGQWVITSVTPR